MRRVPVIGLLLLTLVLIPSAGYAVINPVCDVECSPDPGSTGYGGSIVPIRPLPQNSRIKTQGSQSYSYAIPIVNLPGRNGLDLNLTLYYNSRIWMIDPVNHQAALNAAQE